MPSTWVMTVPRPRDSRIDPSPPSAVWRVLRQRCWDRPAVRAPSTDDRSCPTRTAHLQVHRRVSTPATPLGGERSSALAAVHNSRPRTSRTAAPRASTALIEQLVSVRPVNGSPPAPAWFDDVVLAQGRGVVEARRVPGRSR